MPKKPTQGTKQLGAEIDAELVDRVRAFARGRKETMREVLEMALRRHLANPPLPLPDPPPLPPLTALPPVAKRPRKK